jgi:hypothetical protein
VDHPLARIRLRIESERDYSEFVRACPRDA